MYCGYFCTLILFKIKSQESDKNNGWLNMEIIKSNESNNERRTRAGAGAGAGVVRRIKDYA